MSKQNDIGKVCSDGCELCKHDFEAKPVPQTVGEKWAEVWRDECCGTIGACPFTIKTKPSCKNCRRVQAKAFDVGDSNGYARDARDQQTYDAHEKSQQPKPKPAMTVDDYMCCGKRIAREQVMGYPNDDLNTTTYINIFTKILDDYLKLNRGRLIT